jgi:hypothetical protein
MGNGIMNIQKIWLLMIGVLACSAFACQFTFARELRTAVPMGLVDTPHGPRFNQLPLIQRAEQLFETGMFSGGQMEVLTEITPGRKGERKIREFHNVLILGGQEAFPM